MNNNTAKSLSVLCCVCYVFVAHAVGQNVGSPLPQQIKQEITRLESEWSSSYISGDKLVPE